MALKDGDLLKLGTASVARVEVASAHAEDPSVEAFVQAECALLEQRLRVSARSAGAAAAGECVQVGQRLRPSACRWGSGCG